MRIKFSEYLKTSKGKSIYCNLLFNHTQTRTVQKGLVLKFPCTEYFTTLGHNCRR